MSLLNNNFRIQNMALRTEDLQPEEKQDAWADAMRSIYDIGFPSNSRNGFHAKIDAWLLENLIFTKVAFGEQRFDRRERQLRQDDLGYLSLQIYRSGQLTGILDDQLVQMSPGAIHILDFSRNWQAIADDSVVEGIIIPHGAIGYDPSRHPAHMKFDLQSPTGRVLENAMKSLIQQLPDTLLKDAPPLAAGFRGLLRGLVMSQDSSSSTVCTARTKAMRDYIDQHIAQVTLGPSHLCKAFGISRATVYRAFETDGGLQHYILQRRLEHAFRDLAFGPTGRGRVVKASERWGFTSVSHFSRLFRARFGIPPSEAVSASFEQRAGRQIRSVPLAENVNFEPWLKRLRFHSTSETPVRQVATG
ncbi:MAG: helix-turn-helix domain-containing protein [Pseudomonadota bacterium]